MRSEISNRSNAVSGDTLDDQTLRSLCCDNLCCRAGDAESTRFRPRGSFGFHWGDHSLPKPSEMLLEKNIRALLYKRDTIPEQIRDATEIILKVCDKEGLQQVIWVGLLLSGEEARRKFAVIYAEGAQQYGEADDGDPAGGTASWSSARVTMFAKLADPGFYRIVKIVDGPAFHSCGKRPD